MYYIKTSEVKPDIGKMEQRVDSLMRRGIRLADCKKIANDYANFRDGVKGYIQDNYGIENPNSPKQIVEYLQHLSSQVSINTRNDIVNICYDQNTGKWTSAGSAMSKLADLGYEFAQDLLDYRHAKKYADSVDGLLKAADENNLIHPTITIGKTNRINYKEPAIMNIPKKLLWHLIAPYKAGNVLYSIDIKNQEPLILISMTQAKKLEFALKSKQGLYETMFKQCFKPIVTANVLIDTFTENRVYTQEEIKKIGTISPAYYMPSKPIVEDTYYNDEKVLYIETVCVGSQKGLKPELPSKVRIETENNQYEVDVEWEVDEKKFKKSNDYTLAGELKGLEVRVTKVTLKEFKVAWLAISYGAGALSIKENSKFIDGSLAYRYITQIEELKNYRKMIDSKAKAMDPCINTIFGTHLYAGDVEDYKKLKRILLDLPIQGSAADILSLLIERFYDYTAEHNLSDKMSLYYTRHDELIVEVEKEWLDEVGDEQVTSILRDMLEHQINDWLPFQVEVSQTKAEELEVRFDDEDE